MRLGILLDMFDGVSWTFTVPLFFGSKCPLSWIPGGTNPPPARSCPRPGSNQKGGIGRSKVDVK